MNPLLQKISAAAKIAFPDIPFPQRKDEYWRFGDLKAWGLDSLFPHFSNGIPSVKPDGMLAEVEGNFNGDNSLALFDGQLVAANVPADVEVLPMSTAAERYPDDIQKFFSSTNGKFDTLVSTRPECGAMIVVPDGLSVELKLTVVSKLAFSPSALLFKLGANSGLRLIRNYAENAQTFGVSRSKFILGDGSNLQLATFKYSGIDSHSYQRDDFDVFSNVSVIDAFAQLGVSHSRTERNFEILGSSSDIDTRAFLKTSRDFTHDLRTSQMHRVGGSKSNLAVKAVLSDSSKLAFTGLVRVDENAQKTSAYQSCRSLTLSDAAKTQASPILEILANDVECSHGCTVSRPDFEQIFYMNQRGLPNPLALQLITDSFSQTTFEKFNNL